MDSQGHTHKHTYTSVPFIDLSDTGLNVNECFEMHPFNSTYNTNFMKPHCLVTLRVSHPGTAVVL